MMHINPRLHNKNYVKKDQYQFHTVSIDGKIPEFDISLTTYNFIR